MSAKNPLSPFLILVQDGTAYYKYAKVDWLDQGNGLLLYDYETGEKTSRHSDGTKYSRPAGSGQQVPPTTSVPFSDIRREVVRVTGIPSDVTYRLTPYGGSPPSNAFVYSSTVIESKGTFAAEIVDDSQVSTVLGAWQQSQDYISAQTCRANQLGKTVVLTVLNSRST